jgi:sugar transferase EpsL
MNFYRQRGKRFFDLIVAVPALCVTAPLLLVLAILVRVKLGSPVFFSQQRPGCRGRPFRILKFRSMTDARDANGNLRPDAERLTNFGRMLRSTSLDELPELVNVVRGEMSLVGPRPLLMEYLENYTPEQARRHDVRPGITGWAQINGRKILWRTVFKVARGSGVRLDQTVADVDDIGLHPETRRRSTGALTTAIARK